MNAIEWMTEIPQRNAERGVDLLVVHDEGTERAQHLAVRAGIGVLKPPAHVAAMVGPGIVGGESVKDDDVGPLPIDVDVVGIVEHVSGQATGRSHVHFQSNQPALNHRAGSG